MFEWNKFVYSLEYRYRNVYSFWDRITDSLQNLIVFNYEKLSWLMTLWMYSHKDIQSTSTLRFFIYSNLWWSKSPFIQTEPKRQYHWIYAQSIISKCVVLFTKKNLRLNNFPIHSRLLPHHNLFSLFWPVSRDERNFFFCVFQRKYSHNIHHIRKERRKKKTIINLLLFNCFFLMRNDGMENSMKWNLWRFKSLSSIKLMFVYWNDEIFTLEGLSVSRNFV